MEPRIQPIRLPCSLNRRKLSRCESSSNVVAAGVSSTCPTVKGQRGFPLRVHKPVPRALCSPTSLTVFITLALCGCFGGDDSPASQPSADFSLSLSQPGLMIPSGSSASISISVTGSNGFSSPVAVQITGLPPGITASPASLQVKPGTPQTITFSPAASVVSSSAFVTVIGSSGSLVHMAQLSLSILAPPSPAPPPAATTPGTTP